MQVALSLLVVTVTLPHTIRVEAADMQHARAAVSTQLQQADNRRNVISMIRDLEHRAWCARFDLLCRGLPMDPPRVPPLSRAREAHDAQLQQMTDRQFDAWSRQLVIDEIIDQQTMAEGAERYAAALRIALHERRLPSPPIASTRPNSLLSVHAATAHPVASSF